MPKTTNPRFFSNENQGFVYAKLFGEKLWQRCLGELNKPYRLPQWSDLAAAMCGRDRTSFISEACQKAEEVILDKRLLLLDNVAFEQAMKANPIQSNKRLHQLLERPKRWS